MSHAKAIDSLLEAARLIEMAARLLDRLPQSILDRVEAIDGQDKVNSEMVRELRVVAEEFE